MLVVPGVSTDATGLDALKSVAGMGDAGVYNRPLAGFVPGEVTLVDKWVAFDAAELAPPVNLVAAMLTSKSPFDRRAYDAAMADVDAALKTLNDHLAGATFIANDELTLADVCVACTLYPAMARLLDAQVRVVLSVFFVCFLLPFSPLFFLFPLLSFFPHGRGVFT